MNEVQEFILKRAMQKVAGLGAKVNETTKELKKPINRTLMTRGLRNPTDFRPRPGSVGYNLDQLINKYNQPQVDNLGTPDSDITPNIVPQDDMYVPTDRNNIHNRYNRLPVRNDNRVRPTPPTTSLV
jgi:hypothetical protein